MKKGIFLILLVLLFSSCSRIVMKSYMALSRTGLEKVIKLENEERTREIVMIGMIHVERPEFFEEIRIYLDSLKGEGYVIFCEGVDSKMAGIDSMRRDTLCRKFRRVAGRMLTDYTSKEDQNNMKMFTNGKYAMQSKDILGLTTEQDIRADLSIEELVERYERDKEEIVLTEYDWDTGFLEKYEQQKAGGKNQYSKFYMIQTLRNDHVVEMVKNSDYPKIVILYGKRHWYFIEGPLRKIGYEITEGKL